MARTKRTADGSKVPHIPFPEEEFEPIRGGQEMFLPVFGFVWYHLEEMLIADHPAFQRLSRVNQLGQAYIAWRGATHKRIEHCLGAVHVVQMMINAINHNLKDRLSVQQDLSESTNYPFITEPEIRFIRIGVLLHDIGHIAIGHTVEDELGLVGRHDEDKRLELVFGDFFRDADGKSLGALIDEQYSKFLPGTLKSSHVKASEVVRLLIRKDPKPTEEDLLGASATVLSSSPTIRKNVCRDLIGNTICADLLDYLHRDWHHLGKPRAFDERLLQYMDIKSPDPDRRSSLDQLVISLGQRPKIRTDAISAILDLLDWRYQLNESVLFHRTKITAAAMLDRALYELWGEVDKDQLIKKIINRSDEELISFAIQEALEIAKVGDPRSALTAKRILECIQNRWLYNVLFTRFHDDLAADVRHKVNLTYGRLWDDKNDIKVRRSAPKNRYIVLRALENDFSLEEGSLAMYCPTGLGMNHKIAEVKIAFGEEVESFNKYEEDHQNVLSGGHLQAQLHRYCRLWRIVVVVDPRIPLSQEKKYLLRLAIEKLVLGNFSDQERPLEYAYELAKRLHALGEGKWGKRDLVKEEEIWELPAAAYAGKGVSLSGYVINDIPSLEAFLEKEKES